VQTKVSKSFSIYWRRCCGSNSTNVLRFIKGRDQESDLCGTWRSLRLSSRYRL